MKRLFHIAWRAMGCEVSVQLETDSDGHEILRTLPARVESVEAQLSRFRPSSDLMHFNVQAGRWVKVGNVLFETISAAKHAARLTDGAFNPLILLAMLANGYDRNFSDIAPALNASARPAADWQMIDLNPANNEIRIPQGSAIDLGGIAKGWMAEQLASDLAQYGACLINLGGDLVGRGAPQDLPGWEVIIADPADQTPLISIWLRDASLATSGTDHRRWTAQDGSLRHHIIDPHTGTSAQSDVIAASVHHPDSTLAEAYAKAVLIRGAETGLNWLQSQWNASGLVVQPDRTVLATSQFTSYVNQRYDL